jgi:ABC-2 type transport system ATP-binding protein
MSSAPLLEVAGLCRSFGKVEAVRDLHFTMDRGQVFGFIGPNGAGKTTTMRMLATLDLPDAGDARVDGLSVLERPREACLRLGFMADLFVPYANLLVSQFLEFVGRAYRLPRRVRLRTIESIVEFCGLRGFLDRPTTGLSKGMAQRLHLAKTLIHDPALLVLDEPTAGLDPRARVEFRDLVAALADAGKGILLSSHLLSELAESCDGVVVIEQGRLVVSGAIDAIAKQVRARSAVRMRVASDADAAERFLLTQPFVHEPRRDASSLTFEFEGDEERMADLLAAAVAAGIRVTEFRPVEATLEEIFLRTTQGRLQ